MGKIKIAVITLASSLFIAIGFLPNLAYADCANPATSAEAVQCGSCDAAGQSSCDPAQATTNINDTITSVINLLSLAVGVVAVIMIIVAGFRYITSGGNEQTIATAKKTLLYALIGLAIAAVAQGIARFVLRETTNPNNTGDTTEVSPGAAQSPH